MAHATTALSEKRLQRRPKVPTLKELGYDLVVAPKPDRQALKLNDPIPLYMTPSPPAATPSNSQRARPRGCMG